MQNMNWKKVISTILMAISIFVLAIVIPKLLGLEHSKAIMTTQALELLLSLVAIIVLGKARFAEYGFCRPRQLRFGSFFIAVILAICAGALASITIRLSGASGNPTLKAFNILQLIVFVWFLSSIVEEVFTRGFLQSHLVSGKNEKIIGPLTAPVIISALFFSLMHLVILLSGADILTLIIIMLFTFSLGLLAGYQREQTGSLIPAILVHFFGNVGGFIGGLITVIIYYVQTGSFPTP